MAGLLMANRVYYDAIFDSAENVHAMFSYQFAMGLPLYGGMDPYVQDLWYAPLSFQIMGSFMEVFGVGIRAARIAVILFSVGAMVLVALIAFELTGDRLLAFVAGGLTCAIPSPAWFIAVAVDPFHVCFGLLGMFLLIRQRDRELTWHAVVWATLALCASFWSKQTGLIYLAIGLFYIFMRNRKMGIVCTMLACAVLGAGIAHYTFAPNSSFLHNFFVLQAQHPLVWSSFLHPVVFPENIGRWGPLFAVILAGLWARGLPSKDNMQPEVLFLGVAMLVGLVTRLKYGSGPSQAIMFNCLTLACGVGFLKELLDRGHVARTVVIALLCVQSLALANDYRVEFITREDQSRFEGLKEIVALPDKEVYYANNGFIHALVGKRPVAMVGRECWVNGVKDPSLYPEILRTFFEADPFDIVIVDVPYEENSWVLYERLDRAYVATQFLPPTPRWEGRGGSLRWN